MSYEVFMPRLTHDMTSGHILHWLKKEGDVVKIGEALFEVETDKAVSEVQAEANGILQAIAFDEDQDVPVGAVMAFIVQKGEEFSPSATKNAMKSVTQSSLGKHQEEINKSVQKSHPEEVLKQRLFITPIARRLIKEYHVDIDQLKGSGPSGKIVEADVRLWIKQREEQVTVAPTSTNEMEFEIIRLTDVERITGQRMYQSATSIPQFTLEVDVDMTEIIRLREFITTQMAYKVSYTTLLIEVTAKALRLHPRLNASFVEDQIRSYKSINIGVAMATSQGLIAPVIQKADTLTLATIQERINYFQSVAVGKSFCIKDLSNATFTISNLGMYGIDRFTALINPPQAAILAVGQIREKLVLKAGKPIMQPLMTLRLSVDHRVVDGAIAAPFLMDLKTNIEKIDSSH